MISGVGLVNVNNTGFFLLYKYLKPIGLEVLERY